jgi:hypothetical protein
LTITSRAEGVTRNASSAKDKGGQKDNDVINNNAVGFNKCLATHNKIKIPLIKWFVFSLSVKIFHINNVLIQGVACY